MTGFPCISCGLCCSNIGADVRSAKESVSTHPINIMLKEFPHSFDESGRCEMLGEDNKCSVYDDRPEICNISAIATKLKINREDFFRHNAMSCNELLEANGKEERIEI